MRVILSLSFSFFLFSGMLFSQITVKITSVSSNTLSNDPIYLAGNVNNWNPRNDSFKFTKQANTTYLLHLNSFPNPLEYKITRGSWANVEGNENGQYISNRKSTPNKGDTIFITVKGWEDLGSGSGSTASPNVSVLQSNFWMPQLKRSRKIWVYLPPDYTNSTKKYPVIYMHDGQNLFDNAISFSGEWKVDETLDAMHNQGKKVAIVIGIENEGSQRINEYSPWFDSQYGGGDGEAYISFIKNTLKPFVDSTYRTFTEPDQTAIGGSSMGGLISFYAALKYPETFGKSAVFSPSFPIFNQAYSFASTVSFSSNSRMYLLAGGSEASISKGSQKMNKQMLDSGFNANNLNLKIVSSGSHNEAFWSSEFKAAFVWLFNETIADIQNNMYLEDSFRIWPNPGNKAIHIECSEKLKDFSLEIITPNGQIIYKNESINTNTIESENWPKGIYFLKFKSGSFSQKIRWVKN
jgi:alpha-glucosidase